MSSAWKNLTQKIRMLCCVLINSVIFNLLLEPDPNLVLERQQSFLFQILVSETDGHRAASVEDSRRLTVGLHRQMPAASLRWSPPLPPLLPLPSLKLNN